MLVGPGIVHAGLPAEPPIPIVANAATVSTILAAVHGASGYTIARVNNPRVVADPKVPHETYRGAGQIAGGDDAGGHRLEHLSA